MPGVKGAGGPIPKRSDQRRRRNAPAMPVKKAPAKRSISGRPRVSNSWHPAAKRWYVSLGESGQSKFYEASDWATAWLLAEVISRELKPKPVVVGTKVQMVAAPVKAAALAAFLAGCTRLLATEGDRRRLQIELQQPDGDGEGGASVSSLDAWRDRVAGTGEPPGHPAPVSGR
jgi:hypothetical protein